MHLLHFFNPFRRDNPRLENRAFWPKDALHIPSFLKKCQSCFPLLKKEGICNASFFIRMQIQTASRIASPGKIAFFAKMRSISPQKSRIGKMPMPTILKKGIYRPAFCRPNKIRGVSLYQPTEGRRNRPGGGVGNRGPSLADREAIDCCNSSHFK